jgi:hypothetical protein
LDQVLRQKQSNTVKGKHKPIGQLKARAGWADPRVEAVRVDGETTEKINKIMIYLLRKVNKGSEAWMRLAKLKGLRKK